MYQSVVPLEGETLADTFANYLAQSEQVQAALLLLADAAAVCGLLLEKLPQADERDPDGWNRVGHFAATLALADTRALQPYDLLTKLFPEELLRVFAESMVHPTSNEYCHGGEPWIVFAPEHADILKSGGLTKRDVKQRLDAARELRKCLS